MKRILILLIAVFMSLGLACGSVFIIDKSLTATTSQEQTESQEEDQEISATASGYWADKATSNRPSGSGTVNDPYLIGSAQTLANFAFMVNNNYKNSDTGLLYKDAYVKLTADIDIFYTFSVSCTDRDLKSIQAFYIAIVCDNHIIITDILSGIDNTIFFFQVDSLYPARNSALQWNFILFKVYAIAIFA